MNPILEKEPVKRAERSIKEFNPNLEIICLEQTARTAQDAATALGCSVGAIVKSLLFRVNESFVLCLVSGDKRCSLNKLKKILDEKDVSMANPDEVKKITGYTIGGVSPVGHLNKLKIYIDTNLERFTNVFAAAGHPNCVFEIEFNQLTNLTNGQMKEISRMRQPKLIDYILLTVLALIWASAFFNIKIATYSFGPVTIAFLRVFFGAIPVLLLCYYKNIKIEAFSKDWHWFAMIGFINLVAPFFLIAYGVKSVQSNLAAILMSTTPLSSTVLGHFYTKNEKFNLVKTIGILIGFSGIVFLFSDNILINENNFISALLILLGSTCYVIGGVLTLKISKKKNENVTGSILIWAIIILIPLASFIEQPWQSIPRTDSLISVIYLGIVPTGVAWLLRFRILKNNGLIFQSQVSYLIPIFGTILGYIFLKELITIKVLISLIAVCIGIYFVKKADNKKTI
jgi:Cys-tRNA(Pro) deacylase